MDPLAVASSGAALVSALVQESLRRLEAIKSVHKIIAGVRHTCLVCVAGAIEGIHHDAAVDALLTSIKTHLQRLNDHIGELEHLDGEHSARGSVSRWLCCASTGGEVLSILGQIEGIDGALRQAVSDLVNATRLRSYASRSSNVLKSESARAFWDKHFHDERAVTVRALCEALRFEAKEKGWPADELDVILQTCRNAFGGSRRNLGGDEQVTVLTFGNIFGTGHILESLKKVSAMKRSPPSCLANIEVYTLPHKVVDDSVDALAVMLRPSDKLSDVRRELKRLAGLPDEEYPDLAGIGQQVDGGDPTALDPALAFVSAGAFEFYLDKCKTRVRRHQEAVIGGLEFFPRICIVRSSEVRSKCGGAGGDGASVVSGDGAECISPVADTASEMSDAISAAGDPDDDAARIVDLATQKHADGLTLDDCIANSKLLQALRTHAMQLGISETAVAYLAQLAQLHSACSAVAPPGFVSPARTRLLKGGASSLADRFLDVETPMRLPVQTDTVTRAREALTAALACTDMSRVEDDIFSALDIASTALSSALEPAVRALAARMAVPYRVRSAPRLAAGKMRVRVVIAGGGAGGAFVAKGLDLDERFHVTLVDGKEYSEDPTLQPAALVGPGTDANDPQSGTWPSSVVKYKGNTVINGAVEVGLVQSVAKTHVEVGPDRKIIPYDILVLSTGSTYSCSLKTKDPSLEYRHKQIQQEFKEASDADSILVVGGGLVGVEIAGELAEKFPGKQITLVQARDKLLPRVTGAHEQVSAHLTSLGVKIILNQRVVDFDETHGKHMAITSTGARIAAQKIYRCTGYSPNTWFLRERGTDPAFTAALDSKGFVKADVSLRVQGMDNVWALGDILEDSPRLFTSTGDKSGGSERRAEVALGHATVVVQNIQRTVEAALSGQPEPQLIRVDMARGLRASLAISIGPSKGLLSVDPYYLQLLPSYGLDVGTLSDHQERGFSICAGCTPLKRIASNIFRGYMTSKEGYLAAMQQYGSGPHILKPEGEQAAAYAEDVRAAQEAALTAVVAASPAPATALAADLPSPKPAQPPSAPAAATAEEEAFLQAHPAVFTFLRGKGGISRAGVKSCACPLAVKDEEMTCFEPALVITMCKLGYIAE